MANRDPFVPLLKDKPHTSVDESSQIVALPDLPELFNPSYLDELLPPVAAKPIAAPAKEAPTNSFMKALREEGNRTATDNNSPSFKSTLSAPLDFFSISAEASGLEIHSAITKSWDADPDVTLRLIFCLRSIHDGKAEKDSFYHAYGWLYKNHPRTAIANLPQLVAPLIDRPPPKKPKKPEEENIITPGEAEWEHIVDAKKTSPPLPGFSHGYYKDLLNILLLATCDQLGNPSSEFDALYSVRPHWTQGHRAKTKTKSAETTKVRQGATSARTPKKVHTMTKREARISRTTQPLTLTQHKASAAKAQHEVLLLHLSSSSVYKALYVAVARIFAQQLCEEILTLKQLATPNAALSPEVRREMGYKIGLAAKWAPTLGGAHDRATNIGTAIALVLHASGAMPELPVKPSTDLAVEDALKVRGFYRRWIISPMRRWIHIPERLMSGNQWNMIKYGRVSGTCMRTNKGLFFEHDAVRFKGYVDDVAKGKRKIIGATLLPHELVGEAVSLAKPGYLSPVEQAENNMLVQVVEGQWNALVTRLRESGALDNCLALCDVSGSMGSIDSPGKSKKTQYNSPIFPAVALSMLVSQLAQPPFENTFVTFSATPEIVNITPSEGLVATAKHMVGTEWGFNTDLQAVFVKLILPLAQKYAIKKEDMIKRLFIFSDMQFDDCRSNPESEWKSDHEAIAQAYAASGYDVPEIVYWNLSGNPGASKPVTGDQSGVALLSGFSGNLLKVFMDNSVNELQEAMESFTIIETDGKESVEAIAKKQGTTPVDIMMKAIGKKSFGGLHVVD